MIEPITRQTVCRRTVVSAWPRAGSSRQGSSRTGDKLLPDLKHKLHHAVVGVDRGNQRLAAVGRVREPGLIVVDYCRWILDQQPVDVIAARADQDAVVDNADGEAGIARRSAILADDIRVGDAIDIAVNEALLVGVLVQIDAALLLYTAVY